MIILVVSAIKIHLVDFMSFLPAMCFYLERRESKTKTASRRTVSRSQ
jgi:hypothetical protein